MRGSIPFNGIGLKDIIHINRKKIIVTFLIVSLILCHLFYLYL